MKLPFFRTRVVPMTTWARGFCLLGLVAFGYFLGSSGVLGPSRLQAQNADKEEALSDDAMLKIKAGQEAVSAAQAALQAEQKYVPAITGMNAYAVLAGGVNAVDDLERGRGVDPETFAGLYAGMAVDEVKAKLGKDENGRLTYDGKVIKIYSPERLKRAYAERERLSGIKGKK
jgi:hypothetical protein